MLKPFQFLQDLTQRVSGTATTDEADFWQYAEPANPEPDPLKRNILQWRRVISSVRDPLAEFPGQSVDLVGFVYRTPQDEPEQFAIARQVIRCCLADTVPSTLVVYSPEAVRLKDETWLHLQGEFGVREIKDKPTLVILPKKLKSMRQPKKQYINGVF